jgi:hypothetical protein
MDPRTRTTRPPVAPSSWRGVRRTGDHAALRPEAVLAPLRLLSAVSLWVRATLALPNSSLPPPSTPHDGSGRGI